MKNKRNKELAVCGVAAVSALGKEHPDSIRRLYYTSERAVKFGELCRLLARNKIPYNLVEAGDLEKLCGSVHHQGVVAMIDEPVLKPVTPEITGIWVENREPVLLLDRIGNANNFGAIIRSAAFFGIKNIVIPIHEAQSLVTTSTYRVAQGGMEYVSVYGVRSAVRLLQDLDKKMIRIGTDVRARKSVANIRSLCRKRNSIPLIVLGNEEHGISGLIRENCDELICIPSAFMLQEGNDGSGKEPPVESLNVAQAASIILYELSESFVEKIGKNNYEI